MKIDRRLTLLGVMLVILSMTMATQYATTKIGYRFSIVHPSEADIRFIGSDNASGGSRVLRVNTNDSSNKYMILELGNWTVSQNKSYTAAFAIVNEERFPVNITYINVSGTSSSHTYMDIWVHSNRQTLAWSEAAGSRRKMVAGGVAQTTASNCAWKLGAGDRNVSNCDGGATPWDSGSHVRYSTTNSAAVNGTDDFVWVQITIDIPQTASTIASGTGQIWIHFRASTLT